MDYTSCKGYCHFQPIKTKQNQMPNLDEARTPKINEREYHNKVTDMFKKNITKK